MAFTALRQLEEMANRFYNKIWVEKMELFLLGWERIID